MHRRLVLLLPLALAAAQVAHAQRSENADEELEGRAPRPHLRRVPRMQFRDADLAEAREALRPTATALVPFRRGRAHGYEQHGYVSRSALEPEALVLAALRTWGNPGRMDFVWYERAASIATAPAAQGQGSAGDTAALALRRDSQGNDDRSPAELAAVRAHAEALVDAARRWTRLRLFSAQCGWADSNGALAHGLALVAPATRELYFSYLVETWAE